MAIEEILNRLEHFSKDTSHNPRIEDWNPSKYDGDFDVHLLITHFQDELNANCFECAQQEPSQ